MQNPSNPAMGAAETVPTGKLTPLMQQYFDIKTQHQDKIVLFRMGDFFEMFFRDAEIAAPILNIALTSRNKKSADETPMCGVPHHSVAGVINKLLNAGLRVAICDQVEDPKVAKGIVKRAVTRVLSPGVVFDPETLDQSWAHYIFSQNQEAVAFLDTTTGEAFFYRVAEGPRRDELISGFHPVEEVVDTKLKSKETVWIQSPHDGVAGPTEWPLCAARLYSYFQSLQGENIKKAVTEFAERKLIGVMELRSTVLRHLEVFESPRSARGGIGTLVHAIDRTKTAAGARKLKTWLRFPLLEKTEILQRQARVQHWFESANLGELRRELQGLGDIERRLSKIANPSCNPRDLLSLADSISAGLRAQALAESTDVTLTKFAERTAQRIYTAIREDAPVQTKNGGLIRPGVSEELDRLVSLSENASQLILDLEAREREATGIGSLKVRFNNVFGYYIEITNTHRDKAPSRYQRKQTLANAERFTTDELTTLEGQVLTAQSKRVELEERLLAELIQSLLETLQPLLKLAHTWAELDVVSSLAQLAIEQSYVAPEFYDSGLDIRESRHPVVEQTLRGSGFVANDIRLAAQGCLLLTGPNMAGKSTLMRQVALISILAQMGSFVPATQAKLPIFDQIFTRIGANDSLSEGLSTFMVEMREAAEMLKSATAQSLVILDEIGRGTSTYDGLSLAQAILEYILSTTRSSTLFATHYHELVEHVGEAPGVCVAHMRIVEQSGEITFLHELAKGPAEKSYGIHVAQLAGLPREVIRRAQILLTQHEDGKADSLSIPGGAASTVSRQTEEASPQFDMFAAFARNPSEDLVLQALRAISINELTPLDALGKMAAWQRELS